MLSVTVSDVEGAVVARLWERVVQLHLELIRALHGRSTGHAYSVTWVLACGFVIFNRSKDTAMQQQLCNYMLSYMQVFYKQYLVYFDTISLSYPVMTAAMTMISTKFMIEIQMRLLATNPITFSHNVEEDDSPPFFTQVRPFSLGFCILPSKVASKVPLLCCLWDCESAEIWWTVDDILNIKPPTFQLDLSTDGWEKTCLKQLLRAKKNR